VHRQLSKKSATEMRREEPVLAVEDAIATTFGRRIRRMLDSLVNANG